VKNSKPAVVSLDKMTPAQAKKNGYTRMDFEVAQGTVKKLDRIAKANRTSRENVIGAFLEDRVKSKVNQLPPLLAAELQTLAAKAGTTPVECLRKMIAAEMDRMNVPGMTIAIRLTVPQYAAAKAASILYASGDLERYTKSLLLAGIDSDVDAISSEVRASLKESRQ
jgi:NADP-dependent 3-hydroxy acid dehydrogenase YdfG